MLNQLKHWFKLVFVSTLLLATVLLATPSVAADANGLISPGDIIVNEIMQNPSAVGDTDGEWFEVHNTTGSAINMDGWTIADADSDSHEIMGTLMVPAGGYAVLGRNADSGTNGGVTLDYEYPAWFLANGADEVILSDTSATEIDRVEYDGGPNFPDPNGASMALDAPTNDNNVGANWCEATTPYGDGDFGTPGAANDCIVVIGPGDIIINEIIQNPSAVSDTNGEWFEVYNRTGVDVDLNGWTMADDGTDSHIIIGTVIVPAGGYAVLGRNADMAANGGVTLDYEYPAWFLGNGGDEVVLSDASATEIDRVNYDGGPNFPDPNGASMSLIATTLDNNIGANWCEATTPYGDGDLGTPGAANDCPTGAGPGDIVINEIIQNPSAVADGSGEWFEVYNRTGSDIDMNGWTIADNDSDSHMISGALVVPAGGYAVLGNNTDMGTNGGAPVDYNYGGSWFLSNGADEVVILDDTMTEIDRVEYDGGPNFPDPNGASMALDDPMNDNNVGANWCQSTTPYGDGDSGTPGAANDCPTIPDFGVCSDAATLISVVQGTGDGGSMDGAVGVIVEAVVVGDFQDTATELSSFYIQEEDADADGDAMTSEGLAVFDNGFGVDVNVGDVVRVQGTVDEFFGLTQLTAINNVVVCSSGSSVTPVSISLPVDDIADMEAFEGMSVVFAQTLFATDNFNQGRFGEVWLSVNDRLFNPTNVAEPGAAANAVEDLNDRSRVLLDDASTLSNPPVAPYMGAGNTLRLGDTTSNVMGVLSYGFSNYRIQPTSPVTFTRVNERTEMPADTGGTLTVTSFNVLNYFNGDGMGGGFPTPRGADTLDEFNRQRAKIIDAILDMDADIIGLMELENDGFDNLSAIQDLVNGLNLVAQTLGVEEYAFIDAGGPIGTDAIAVGFIYRPAVVMPVGTTAVLDDVVPFTVNTRPPLAQTFEEIANGERVIIVVNHFKSKSSFNCPDTGPNADAGDGQGCWNGDRVLAAQELLSWLATDPTGTAEPDVLIMGDLNAYALEDPIDTIIADGFTNLIAGFLGPDAYSFVFFGEAGYLDHALANAPLLTQITGVAEWHINADEPRALDYNDFNQTDLYVADQHRSSDHDPVLIGLALGHVPTSVALTGFASNGPVSQLPLLLGLFAFSLALILRWVWLQEERK